MDQEVILECVYYGTLLYEALSKETVMMEETDFHHPIEEERARMLCEGTPFFCEKMNEILERKTLEKNQFDLCLCPDFIPLRRRIEDWFSEVETN